jgi:hypothetical protein
MKRSILALFVLPLLMAADPCVSGPQPGQRPGPYSFVVATGANRGQLTCFICETDDKPAAIVFTRKLTPEVGKLLSTFDAWVGENPKDAVASWMTVLGEKTVTSDNLAKWSKETGLKQIPVGIFDDPDGPPSYRLNKEAEVTVLLFTKKKVIANYALQKNELTDKTIEKIKGDLKSLK